MNRFISIFLIVLGSVNLASAEQACTARNCSNCEKMFVFNHQIQAMASSNLARSTNKLTLKRPKCVIHLASGLLGPGRSFWDGGGRSPSWELSLEFWPIKGCMASFLSDSVGNTWLLWRNWYIKWFVTHVHFNHTSVFTDENHRWELKKKFFCYHMKIKLWGLNLAFHS